MALLPNLVTSLSDFTNQLGHIRPLELPPRRGPATPNKQRHSPPGRGWPAGAGQTPAPVSAARVRSQLGPISQLRRRWGNGSEGERLTPASPRPHRTLCRTAPAPLPPPSSLCPCLSPRSLGGRPLPCPGAHDLCPWESLAPSSGSLPAPSRGALGRRVGTAWRCVCLCARVSPTRIARRAEAGCRPSLCP